MATTSRYCGLGEETVYGTAVAATRSFEDTGDDWTLDNQPVEVRDTTRVGAQALLEHNRRYAMRGASGSINIPVYENGLGLLWSNLLGTATTPAAVASTTRARFSRNYRSSAAGDNSSFTVRRGRSYRVAATAADAIEEFIYAGCVPVSANLSLASGDKWMLGVTFDAQSEATGGSAVTQAYPAAQQFFDWRDTRLLIDGTEVPYFGNFSLDMGFNLDTAIYTFSGTSNKQKPTRVGVPTFTGTLDAPVYTDTLKTSLYDKFRAGDTVSIVLEATKGATAAADQDILRITLARCQWSGSTPQGSPGANTAISGGFEVLHSGASTDYAVEVYLQNGESTDA